MIDSYFVNTPNGRKVSVMLAETGLPHRLIRGDRGEVDHLSKAFRRINPNARLPAIVDHDPLGSSLRRRSASPQTRWPQVTCKDGTTSKAGQGPCSHHGGVAPPHS